MEEKSNVVEFKSLEELELEAATKELKEAMDDKVILTFDPEIDKEKLKRVFLAQRRVTELKEALRKRGKL